VETIEDLLVESAYNISIRCEGLAEEEVNKAVLAAHSFFGGTETDAFHVLATELGVQHHPTGDTEFDGLFGGGLPTGKILEVVGGMGVGKSQLCMWLSASLVAQNENHRVVFISSDNSLDAVRLLSLLPSTLNRQEKEFCLARIEVRHCFRWDQLMRSLYQLKDEVSSQALGVGQGQLVPACVIVDSMASLIQPVLGKMPLGHSLIFSVRSVLLNIATVCNAGVVVTNFTLTGDWQNEKGNALNLAMGASWGTVSHSKLWVTKPEGRKFTEDEEEEEDEDDEAILTLPGIVQRACMMKIGDKRLKFLPIGP
jgi:hypothetical protein